MSKTDPRLKAFVDSFAPSPQEQVRERVALESILQRYRGKFSSDSQIDQVIGLLKQDGVDSWQAERVVEDLFNVSRKGAYRAVMGHPAWREEADAANELLEAFFEGAEEEGWEVIKTDKEIRASKDLED